MKARVIVVHDGKVLLERRVGPKGRAYVRPLGGNIEFGERGHDTVTREMTEETGLHLTNVRYLGCLEDVGSTKDGSWHEICLLYQADLHESNAYTQQSVRVQEGGQRAYSAYWIPIDHLRATDEAPWDIRPLGLHDWVTQALAHYTER